MKLVPVPLLGKIAESWKQLTSALRNALGQGPLCSSLIYGRVYSVTPDAIHLSARYAHRQRQQNALSLPKQRLARVFCLPCRHTLCFWPAILALNCQHYTHRPHILEAAECRWGLFFYICNRHMKGSSQVGPNPVRALTQLILILLRKSNRVCLIKCRPVKCSQILVERLRGVCWWCCGGLGVGEGWAPHTKHAWGLGEVNCNMLGYVNCSLAGVM